jgi:hypothetical protein
MYTQWKGILSFDKFNVQTPENLTPWSDSNPGTSVLGADAMTTMPRRKGMRVVFTNVAGSQIPKKTGVRAFMYMRISDTV